jgi:FMN phosphatase YigB (HAD superfamily)
LISEETKAQLAGLELKAGLPLVISDVDDVVVHFLKAFEEYLHRHDLWLDAASLALTGNIKRKSNALPITVEEVEHLIDRFFIDMTLHMEPIDQAVDMLNEIGNHANVVLLTNAPHGVADDRRNNLLRHGLPFPVITNSGPKGPAIRHLTSLTQQPAVFIDDSPSFLRSAFEWAPEIKLVHFMQDLRFRRYIKEMDFVHLHTSSWQEAGPFILDAVRPSI